jgi:hypothetical protein
MPSAKPRELQVPVTKTAAMRYIAECAGHGYVLYQAGVIDAAKAQALVERLADAYGVLATRGARFRTRTGSFDSMDELRFQLEFGTVVPIPRPLASNNEEAEPTRYGLAARVSHQFLATSRELGGVASTAGVYFDPVRRVGLAVVMLRSGDEMHAIVFDPRAHELSRVLDTVEQHQTLFVACVPLGVELGKVVCVGAQHGLDEVVALCKSQQPPDRAAVREAFVNACQEVVRFMRLEADRPGSGLSKLVLQVVGLDAVFAPERFEERCGITLH